jgi:hypothetical protein
MSVSGGEILAVVDSGPIAYSAMALFGDMDLEHGLWHAGYDPAETSYRLLRIPLMSIDMVRSGSWGRMGTHYVEALAAGVTFPPIVVRSGPGKWVLLDGVNRTHAYTVAGVTETLAYQVLDHPST